ncbi:uncharacterized protein LOC117653963 [Thrips palmi]|uniref:Uncharacterized protein LOC117653963 n=1 Tax=Thrips palmi TaxID=161013 RepID=A0A6P9AEN6_THRPL|nr:uncharacterized protein LOC117653963 [Thrips palmi]
MDAKRSLNMKKANMAPLSKAKSISSLKTKGDISSESSWRTSTTIKNPPSATRVSSSTPTNSSGKCRNKDIKYRSYANLNEINAEQQLEEAKLDEIDSAFNSYITSNAMKALVDKSKHKISSDIDKQISNLQKRVNDNLDALEKTRSKLNVLSLVEEQSNLLAHQIAANNSFSNEPAFMKGKSFQELMVEIDRIKNQMPCKNVSFPETPTELGHFRNATNQLLHSLEMISTTYGADQPQISRTSAELDNIAHKREAVSMSKISTDAVALQTGTRVFNEAITKTRSFKL